MNESDFNVIRREQSLGVDFSAFPFELKRLLELCENADKGEESEKRGGEAVDGQSSSYLCTLHVKPSQSNDVVSALHIVHRSHFRQVNFLTLAVQFGSDVEIKRMLSEKVALLKEEVENTREQLEHTTQEKHSVEMRNIELNDEREREHVRYEQLQRLNAEEFQKMALAQRNVLEAQTEKQDQVVAALREEYSAQIGMIQQQLLDTQSKLQQQVTLHQNVTQALDHKSHALALSNKDLQSCRNDLETARTHRDKLETDRDEERNKRQSGERRVAQLEQQVNDQHLLNSKFETMLHNEREQRAVNEQNLSLSKSKIDELQAKLEASSADCFKAQELITKLQAKLSSSRGKCDKRKNIIHELEDRMHRLEQGERKVESTMLEQQNTIERLQNEIARYEDRCKTLQATVEELTKQNKDHITTIAYLNQRENEKGMSRMFMPASFSASNALGSLFPASTASINKSAVLKQQIPMNSLPEKIDTALDPSSTIQSQQQDKPVPLPAAGASVSLSPSPAALSVVPETSDALKNPMVISLSSAALNESVAKVLESRAIPSTPVPVPHFVISGSSFYSLNNLSSPATATSQPGHVRSSTTPLMPLEQRLSAVARSHLGMDTVPNIINRTVPEHGKITGGAMRVLSNHTSFQPSSIRPQLNIDKSSGQLKIVLPKPSDLENHPQNQTLNNVQSSVTTAVS